MLYVIESSFCFDMFFSTVSVDHNQIWPVVKQKGENLTLPCIFNQSVEWRCQWKIGKIFNGNEFITKNNNDLVIINLNNSGICGCYHGSRDAPIAEYNITAEGNFHCFLCFVLNDDINDDDEEEMLFYML